MIGYAVLGGFVLDAVFGDLRGFRTRWCIWARPSLRWKRAACPPAQNAGGRTLGRAHFSLLSAGGHLCAYLPCLHGRCRPAPAAGAGSADVLVRTGTGGKGTCAGEYERLPGADKARPACRPHCRKPHRGAGHAGAYRRRRDQGRCGDRGGKRQRWRDRAAVVYAAGRRSAGTDLQGHQHDGQYAGLQKRKIPLLGRIPAKLDDAANYLPAALPPCCGWLPRPYAQ